MTIPTEIYIGFKNYSDLKDDHTLIISLMQYSKDVTISHLYPSKIGGKTIELLKALDPTS